MVPQIKRTEKNKNTPKNIPHSPTLVPPTEYSKKKYAHKHTEDRD
jgi:hypothetical protein